MGHDQFFKDFFRAFFRDFLELFYPEISARLDFGTLRFLEQELFTDFPEGSLREADVVAELETRDGVKELVGVHIEAQLRWERNFGRADVLVLRLRENTWVSQDLGSAS